MQTMSLSQVMLCLLVGVPLTSAFQATPVAGRRAALSPMRRGSVSVQEKLVKQNTERSLAFDDRTGRFFESDIEEACREEYCLVDEETGKPIPLTVEEKERIFLDSLQSYYYSGEGKLSNDDFDKLREDLQWEGSKVATLNRKETLFLNAMGSYMKGAPVISDSEFDELKKSLREEGSAIAVQTEPQCYLDTGICKVTWVEDRYRKTVLSLPGATLSILGWIGLSWQLLPPLRAINPLLSLLLATPLIVAATEKITGILVQDAIVAQGPCPTCNASNSIFFGDVLFVEGFGDEAKMKCKNCKEELTIIRSTLRVSSKPKA